MCHHVLARWHSCCAVCWGTYHLLARGWVGLVHDVPATLLIIHHLHGKAQPAATGRRVGRQQAMGVQETAGPGSGTPGWIVQSEWETASSVRMVRNAHTSCSKASILAYASTCAPQHRRVSSTSAAGLQAEDGRITRLTSAMVAVTSWYVGLASGAGKGPSGYSDTTTAVHKP
jgi:hypothetical protein